MKLFVLILALCWGHAAAAQCRLALALALDVSGSVDAEEYELQLNGVADALGNDDVKAVILAAPEAPVALSIYEWSSSSYQRMILDWTLIKTESDILEIRQRLTGWTREAAPEATGLGAALEYGARLIERAPACWDQTLDVSADGKNNDWPVPSRLRESGQLGSMTVNGLVVTRDFKSTIDMTLDGVAEMTAYFRHQIIHGPQAFIEVAQGYEDYATAMTRKLLRELATLPMGEIDIAPPAGLRRASSASAAPELGSWIGAIGQ